MTDDPKSDWDHLRDGFKSTGIDMKLNLDFKFEGTFEAFVGWAQETFKDPSQLPLTVTVSVGGKVPTSVDFRWQGMISELRAAPFNLNTPDADLVTRLTKLEQLYHVEGPIPAIKYFRNEICNSGLREAKDFVEKWFRQTAP